METEEQIVEPVNQSDENRVGGNNTIENNPQQLFGDYANEPSIQKFKSPADLAKSYINLEKLVGKNRIPIPEKPEEFDQVWDALGRPQDPQEYPVPESLGKVFGDNKEAVENLKQFAHEIGLLPQQAEKLFDAYAKDIEQSKIAYEQQAQTELNNTLEELKQEWGDTYEDKMQRSTAVFSKFSEETRKAIDASGLGRNKEFIEFLANVSNLFVDGNAPVDNTGAYNVDVGSFESELKRLTMDKNSPYYDKYHSEHKAAVERVKELYNILQNIKT